MSKSNEQLKAEFTDSDELQEEFASDVDAYIAFVRADEKGLVRILSRPSTREGESVTTENDVMSAYEAAQCISGDDAGFPI